MKQKIKIMKPIQQPSDEEIQSYMNFDRLLDRRKIAMSSTRTISSLVWSITAFTVTALLVWFFMYYDGPPANVRDDSKKSPDAVEPSQQSDRVVVVDSSMEQSLLQRKAKEIEAAPPAKIKESHIEKSERKESARTEQRDSEYVQAEPANGYSDLYNFFNVHLVYPAEGVKDSIQGIQTISFVINKEGKPEQIEVVNPLGESFEKECRRLIQNMPAWKPATLNGKPVASKISLPITFQIQKIKK